RGAARSRRALARVGGVGSALLRRAHTRRAVDRHATVRGPARRAAGARVRRAGRGRAPGLSARGHPGRIATVLAGAGIPILAQSTFDTDYILVREDDLGSAVGALRADGIVVDE